jgi:hypothetical protein
MSDEKDTTDLAAQVEKRRLDLESANAVDHDLIVQARARIATRKVMLDALPVPRRRRKAASEQKTGGDNG